MNCKQCGGALKKIGGVKNTIKYLCSECYDESIQFIAEECEHKYEKGLCIHCGRSE